MLYTPGDRSETMQCSHILVREEALALQVQAELNGGADFAAKARQYSQCTSKSNGGDLGQFHRGELVPAFEAAACVLAVGQTSGIVPTKFGFHLIKRTA
jgi:peptidyl-prolyl cis-trans isomerase C